MNRLRKDDRVQVAVGRDRGKIGKVLRVLPEDERALVEGLNLVKRHRRRRSEQQQGGIIEQEAPIHVSNLRLICPRCNRPTRVGTRVLQDGSRTRICRRCGEPFARA